MELAEAKIGRRERQIWAYAKGLSPVMPVVLAAFFYLYFQGRIDFLSPMLSPIAFASLAVNVILAGIYFYAYKFLDDDFYFFIAATWFASIIYTLLDANRAASDYPLPPSYRWGILLLYSTSDIYLLLSLFAAGAAGLVRMKRRIILIVLVGLAFAAAEYLLLLLLPASIRRNEAMLTAPLSAVSFILLIVVGWVLRGRLGGDKAGLNGVVLPLTFYYYAFLQLLTPFSRYSLGITVTVAVVVAALLIKVVQAIALQGALQFVIANRGAALELGIREAEFEAEREKFETKSQLVELGLLASSIKHDITTPLATISVAIRSLRERYQHERGIQRKLDTLEDSVERINAIVSAVDIIRGKQALSEQDGFMAKVDMLEIVHRAVWSLKNEVEALKQPGGKRIVIDKSSATVMVRAYRPMFEQVVVNVIKNGLEAIEEGGRETGLVRVYVGPVRPASGKYAVWAKVEIEDNGGGIPEENLAKLKLSAPFTTRSDRKVNSGIGLFIGMKIIKIHGGTMTFESKVGVGTKVTLMLPEWNALRRAEGAERADGAEAGGSEDGADGTTLAEATPL
ncbi:MAG: HAMP domain-containing histidine kinase [Acidobacteria bacterium]|nr:HAMP domain-containing histidine kinase [Acidobacteriota bacterium]